MIPATATAASESVSVPFPSWPEMPAPQQRTAPLMESMLQPWKVPAEICADVGKDVSRGEDGVSMGERASWPNQFDPQHDTVPETRRAQVCSSPELNDATPVAELVIGTLVQVRLPLPSWPIVLAPQHLTDASDSLAQVCRLDADTVVALAMPETVTGLLDDALLPLPSCPDGFDPEHRMVPSVSTAQVPRAR